MPTEQIRRQLLGVNRPSNGQTDASVDCLLLNNNSDSGKPAVRNLGVSSASTTAKIGEKIWSSSSFICKNKYNDSKLVRVQDQQGSKSTYGDPKKTDKKPRYV